MSSPLLMLFRNRRRPSPFAIVAITDAGGAVLVTTAAPHGLAVEGTSIIITGTDGYDMTTVTTFIVSTTVFHIDAAYIGDSFGGTWAPA